MKHELRALTALALILLVLSSCNTNPDTSTEETMTAEAGYAKINGLNMYYEIHGTGQPIVLIHGGGSTIQSNFAYVIPFLAKTRKVIAVELQAHGRTSDREQDLSFEQDAADVVALLQYLQIAKADFFGFSNGATTTLQLAIRYPQMVNKIVLGSPLAKRNGVPDFFWGYMENASLDNMPPALKEAYLRVKPDQKGLQTMHDRDAKRMVHFQDIPDAQITAITSPTMIVIGDQDVITPEHALELHRQIAASQLVILPGGHGGYIGEVTTQGPYFKETDLVFLTLMEKFLSQP